MRELTFKLRPKFIKKWKTPPDKQRISRARSAVRVIKTGDFDPTRAYHKAIESDAIVLGYIERAPDGTHKILKEV